jgi:putative hemolysin
MAVAVHPADPGRIYCATRGGQVIGTEDSGKSWTDHRLPGGVHDVYAVACV